MVFSSFLSVFMLLFGVCFAGSICIWAVDEWITEERLRQFWDWWAISEFVILNLMLEIFFTAQVICILYSFVMCFYLYVVWSGNVFMALQHVINQAAEQYAGASISEINIPLMKFNSFGLWSHPIISAVHSFLFISSSDTIKVLM